MKLEKKQMTADAQPSTIKHLYKKVQITIWLLFSLTIL